MTPLLIFDLDGTLIDSRQDLADSTNEMLASYGAPTLPTDEVAAMVGEGALMLVRRALLAAALRRPPVDEAVARFREIYDRRLLEHTRPYPGILVVVRHAAERATLAVLTNKPEAPSRRILEALGLLASFRWVVGGDGVWPRKPDPASVAFLRQQAGVDRSSTLFIGDSSIDVTTARRAGVRLCVARYGFGRLDATPIEEGEEAAASPAELGKVINRFIGPLPG